MRFNNFNDTVELMPTSHALIVNKSKGFTLIELLITISVIAILSVIGMVVYTSVLKQGRDSKRQSDLRAIQSALEQYRSDEGHYPRPLTLTQGNSLTGSSGRVYLTQIPGDPTGSPGYLYYPYGSNCEDVTPQNCVNYCVYAKLEIPITSWIRPAICTDTTYNYAVTLP